MKLVPSLSLALLSLAAGCLPLNGQEVSRSFSVKDSIEMVRFNVPSENLQSDDALYSPDHRYFVVVTSRGQLQSNETESTITLYRTSEVEQYLASGRRPHRRRLFVARAVPDRETPSAHAPIIAQIRWDPDSRHFYFLRETSKGRQQLCEISISSGEVSALTRRSEDVRAYDVAGGAVAYTTTRLANMHGEVALPPSRGYWTDARDITGKTIESLLFPDDPSQPVMAQLWVVRNGQRIPIGQAYEDSGFGGAYSQDIMKISPDGTELVMSHPAEDVPEAWSSYKPMDGFPTLRIDPQSPLAHSPYNNFRPREFVLVNLKNQRISRVIGAPLSYGLGYSDVQTVKWSSDGRRVLLTGTFVPPDPSKPLSSDSAYGHPCVAAILDIPSQERQCLAPSRWDLRSQRTSEDALLLSSAELNDRGDTVTLDFRYPGKKSVVENFLLRSKHWINVSSDVSTESAFVSRDSRPKVCIRQSVDQHPVLLAKSASNPSGLVLWDPNPQLASLHMGEATIFHWTDPTGYRWTGGLVKPVGYTSGKRYPLVIQTHGFQPYRFLSDAFYPTAMAALPLASAGFVVLQVDTRRTHYTSPQEAEDQIIGIDAAIDALTHEGLIDSSKVGIAGFSRTSWYVESALIRDPKRFAAAAIADGVDQGYLQYRLFEDTPNMKADSEAIHGGEPTDHSLTQWMEKAPPFHADRIRTPLLIQALGPRSILMEWEIYSALYHRNASVNLLYLPHAQHVLQHPRDLFASEQSVVDWFQFCLLPSSTLMHQKPLDEQKWK